MRKQAQIDSPTYMELALHLDGKESLILRIPTFWDAVKKQWIGAIKTPKTHTLITSEGGNSQELQENFTRTFGTFFENEKLNEEIYSMFKPLYVWEAIEKAKGDRTPKEPKPADQEQAEKAFQLLDETLESDPSIERNIWAAAFWSILVQNYVKSGLPYDAFVNECNQMVKNYRHWFEENEK